MSRVIEQKLPFFTADKNLRPKDTKYLTVSLTYYGNSIGIKEKPQKPPC